MLQRGGRIDLTTLAIVATSADRLAAPRRSPHYPGTVGTLLLAVGVVLVATTAALVACCLRLRSAVGYLLAAYLLATAEVLAVSLALSPARLLTRGALLFAFVALLAVALAAWARRGRPSPPLRGVAPAIRSALGDRVVAILAMLAILTHVYLLAGALTVPQSSPDTLLYHLPRAALWKQHDAVAYVADAPDERVDATPPNAEIEIAASMILSGVDRYATLVQLAAVLATCLAIAGIARRLGLSVREAAFGAVIFSTYTLVALQTPTALNDLALAAPLVVCAYFGMGRSRVELGLAALALALALGTKLTTVVAVPVLVAFVLAAQPRSRWPALGLAGIAGVAMGSAWYVVNLAYTGKVDGGLAGAFPQVPDRSAGSSVDRIGLLFKDFFELSGSEGQGWLWSPTPGFVVGLLLAGTTVVLLSRSRRRAAAIAALLGLTVAIVYPTLATWVDVSRRAARQTIVIAGISDDAPAARVPLQLYESSIHSSYGIAFVVLFLWVGALVVRETSRRRLPVATVVAVAAPPVFLVVFSLAIAYDPARMRFAAFPVALASATFGVALRMRLLAWISVALTIGTLAVSVGYFAPRPASVALLPGHDAPERDTRWFIQAESGNGDPDAFRFLEEQVPADATVALAVARNTYLYPAWDARLRRTVVFEMESGAIPGDAGWLVVGPRHDVDEMALERAGWQRELATPRRWRIFRR